MGSRKHTWCDFCGKEGPVEGVQLTTDRQKRSTEAPARKSELCDECKDKAILYFNSQRKFTAAPAVKKRS
jgi:hypothetical protein